MPYKLVLNWKIGTKQGSNSVYAICGVNKVLKIKNMYNQTIHIALILHFYSFKIILVSYWLLKAYCSGGSSVRQNELPQLILGYIYILKYLQSNFIG